VTEIYPRASDKVDAYALHLAPSRSFAKIAEAGRIDAAMEP